MKSDALIGRTIGGRFRVTGFIGDGAMATVYRGAQDGEPPDVAIKVMKPQLALDRTFVGRFKREAKAASRLSHRNTVRILQTGVDEQLLYIVMELLAGQDLFERLVLERRLTEARAADVLAQVCDALGAAHDAGVVHRDLKPENVMLVPDPERPGEELVKVLDFGIAKILDSEDPDAPPNSLASSMLTRVGVVVGTPAYMSPEQCSGRPIDGRSDLYGCGVLLFQLVTGRMPFTGETPFDYAIKHVREPPPPPREFVPAIHPELEATILKALAKDPAQRQSSARELSAQLRRLLPDLATELRPVRGPLTTATRTSSSAATAEMPLPQVPDDEPTAEPRRLASLDAAELDQAITLASRAGAPAAPLPVTPAPGGTPQGVRPESPPPLPPMPSRVTTAVALEPAEPRGRMVAWLLVPVALAIGIAVGVAVFVLTR